MTETKKQTRSTNPRIVELEAQIAALVAELVAIVQPDGDERLSVYEEMRDMGPEAVGDLDACYSALDWREIDEE